jgi:hypothetical protein
MACARPTVSRSGTGTEPPPATQGRPTGSGFSGVGDAWNMHAAMPRPMVGERSHPTAKPVQRVAVGARVVWGWHRAASSEATTCRHRQFRRCCTALRSRSFPGGRGLDLSGTGRRQGYSVARTSQSHRCAAPEQESRFDTIVTAPRANAFRGRVDRSRRPAGPPTARSDARGHRA